MLTARVAFSKDFLSSYSKLPRKIQRKVRDFTEKFQRDPTQSGVNFERLNGCRDSKVRSVRIDQAYRAIVIHPPKGDVFLCVWVAHHDDAYDWVRNKRFEVNPRLGTFQLFELTDEAVEAAERPEPVPVAPPTPRLFDTHDEEDLLLAGVPQVLLATVQALKTDDDLDELAPHLPADSAEMLYLLAAGYTLYEAIEEADRTKSAPAAVDVEDFEAALARPESQGTFRVVDDEEELEAMLDAPLEQWRVFLHPSQRRLVKMDAKGPVRVLGGAGTGKTVVLMHRARHLVSEVFTDPNDRVLVTTFTKNLALDLKANLKQLCGREAFGRLEIVNLHKWADAFMKRQGHPFRLLHSERKRRELFETAVSEGDDEFPLEFYIEEWDQVVQPQDVDSRDAYLTARRVGRGTRLGRKQRARAWQVFERYRELLEQGGYSEWQDLVREARMFIEKQRISLPYRAVLSDEVQDFTVNELKLLRAIVPPGPQDLFVVGDAHQRIYGMPTVLGRCGIEIRGRSRRLKVNYRTTEQIRNRAVSILEGCDVDDLDGGLDSLKGYSSLRHGPTPEIQHFASEAEERQFIVDRLKAWIDGDVPAESICLSARTHAQLDERYEPILKGAGYDVVQVQTDPEAEADKPGIRLATMHRMKGLEFSRVLLAGVQEGKCPLQTGPSADAASEEDHELRERCLLYVAATRARDELAVCGFGEPSRLL